MALKTESSKRWLRRQMNDPYVLEAKKKGYRSRAAFKLIQLQASFKFLKPGHNVVDLGAAPGGWSQIAADVINKGAKGTVYAIDLLEFDELPHVKMLQGDFTDEATLDVFEKMIGDKKIDVVMSDMSPSTSGHKSLDHMRIIILCEEAYHFALRYLNEGGTFVAKVFQGGTEGELLKDLKKHFKIVKHAKPDASRKESKETYLIATGFKGC